VERTCNGSLRSSSAPLQGQSRPECHRAAAGSPPHFHHGFVDNAGDLIIGDEVEYFAGWKGAVGRCRGGEVAFDWPSRNLSNGRAPARDVVLCSEMVAADGL
jgi:hypothetical protein